MRAFALLSKKEAKIKLTQKLNKILCLSSTIGLMALAHTASAADIRLAVAANFRPTLTTLVNAYNQHHKVKFGISSASTGVLYAQIKQGAPFDIFFSADATTPERLSQQFKQQLSHQATSGDNQAGFDDNPFTYAHGLLAFWCLKGSPQTMQQMSNWQGSYALANPKLAPYGKAALKTITALNWQGSRAIKGNNVAQVAQFILTQSVNCGFVAKSLLPTNTPSKQTFIIDEQLYGPIVQKALILPHAYSSKEKALRVKHFVEFIQDEARELIAKAGYGLPNQQYVYNTNH